MASITRDRGCFYYVPWIASFCTCILIAALGIWVHWTNKCKDLTVDALDILDIKVKNLDRIEPALIATAICYLVIAVLIFLASLWRSFVEAGHDATGITSGSATAFLVVALLLELTWWCGVVWVILLTMADTVWAALLYISKEALATAVDNVTQHGQGTWLPSSGEPCPGQCLNLTLFDFVSSELQDACICDMEKLKAARSKFQDAYEEIPGVVVGVWVMMVAGLCLLINFACQFSHTKRERELLMRIAIKPFAM